MLLKLSSGGDSFWFVFVAVGYVVYFMIHFFSGASSALILVLLDFEHLLFFRFVSDLRNTSVLGW